MTTEKKKEISDRLVTYLVETGNGRKKITVPSTWKVTFGPVLAGSGAGYGGSERCLRFYESKEQQRAIFTGVTSFRDLSIPVEIERVTREEKSQSKANEKGSKHESERRVEKEWAKDEVTF